MFDPAKNEYVKNTILAVLHNAPSMKEQYSTDAFFRMGIDNALTQADTMEEALACLVGYLSGVCFILTDVKKEFVDLRRRTYE